MQATTMAGVVIGVHDNGTIMAATTDVDRNPIMFNGFHPPMSMKTVADRVVLFDPRKGISDFTPARKRRVDFFHPDRED